MGRVLLRVSLARGAAALMASASLGLLLWTQSSLAQPAAKSPQSQPAKKPAPASAGKTEKPQAGEKPKSAAKPKPAAKPRPAAKPKPPAAAQAGPAAAQEQSKAPPVSEAEKTGQTKEEARADLARRTPSAPSLGPADAARRYVQGLDLEREGDLQGAFAAYQQAAEAGNGHAQKKLGDFYGKGTPHLERDYESSLRWYDRARQQGIEIPKPFTFPGVRQ